jgi:iron complex outermembrane receptor protein
MPSPIYARVSTARALRLHSSSAVLALVGCCALWPAAAPAEDENAAGPANGDQPDVVVVTASPIAGSPDRFATIVTQVSRDDILQSGGANLADALKDVPGVASTGFAAGASRPVIRGMDAFRVKVLEDGVDAGDVSEVGPDHGVPIDPLSARDIEVVRGAATLRWGSQAIGGVVNAINNRVPLTLSQSPLSGEASASYDANGAAGAGSALVDARLGQFAFHADGSGRRASDYETPDGRQLNSFFRGDAYSGGGSYFFGDNNADRTGLAYTHYDAKYGIPSDTTFIDMRQDKVLTNNAFHISNGVFQTLNVTGGYSNYIHDEIEPSTDEILSTFKNREWSGRAEQTLGAIGPLTDSAIGVDYSDRHFSAGGEGGNFLSPTHTQTAAIFGFTETKIGKRVNLQAAMRVEHVLVDGTPASGVPTDLDFTPISGSLGVLYDLDDVTKIGLTVTSAARAPGQVELFAHGPHDGPATFETGDPTLDIERANSIEATLRYHPDRFSFEGSMWGAWFNNYIFGALTGQLCDENEVCAPSALASADQDLKQLDYAQRDANFWGAEGRGTYDLARYSEGTLQIIALGDLVHAAFTDHGGYVPRIQPSRIGGGLEWTSDEVDVGFLALSVGPAKHVPVGDTTTEGYFDFDAHFALRPAGAKGLEISIVGHNLTDEVQRDAVALNRDVVEMPGRNVRLVVRQSF